MDRSKLLGNFPNEGHYDVRGVIMRRTASAVLSALAGLSLAVLAVQPASASPALQAKLPGAPYLYEGWGSPPNATDVMSQTGVRSFTMAFMLSGGGCNPMWDSQRPLGGGVDEQTINSIKGAGGSVEISFGGWSGNELGPNCSDSNAYA